VILKRATTGPSSRGAFTLVEILVVITILTLLLSLSAGTYMLVMRTQREKNTQMLTEKLKGELQKQKRAFDDDVKSGKYGPMPDAYVNHPQAGGDPNRARQLWLTDLWQTEFPTTFAAAWNNPRYQRLLQAAGYTGGPPQAIPVNPSPEPAPSEPSACLVMILSVSRSGSGMKLDDLAPGALVDQPDVALNGTQVRAADNLKEIRDAWGEPLEVIWNYQTGEFDIRSRNPK
jgi:prepilin-type N-terminal cleavage/methylation domain-containing protein